MQKCGSPIYKVFTFLFIGVFLFTQVISGSEISDFINLSDPKDCLAAHSSFFHQDFRHDASFKALASAIGSHFFKDNRDLETLPKDMREEFLRSPESRRSIVEIFELLDLENVYLSKDKDIIYVPYEIDNNRYKLKICRWDDIERLGYDPARWEKIDELGVQKICLSLDARKERSKWEERVEALVKDGQVKMSSGYGGRFTFKYVRCSDEEPDAFRILAYSRGGKLIGYIDAKGHFSDFRFEDPKIENDEISVKFPGDNVNALEVASRYSNRYSGTGKNTAIIITVFAAWSTKWEVFMKNLAP